MAAQSVKKKIRFESENKKYKKVYCPLSIQSGYSFGSRVSLRPTRKTYALLLAHTTPQISSSLIFLFYYSFSFCKFIFIYYFLPARDSKIKEISVSLTFYVSVGPAVPNHLTTNALSSMQPHLPKKKNAPSPSQ